MPEQRDDLTRLRRAHYSREELPDTISFSQHLKQLNRRAFQPQIDDSRTVLDPPGTVDQVGAMADIPDAGGHLQ